MMIDTAGSVMSEVGKKFGRGIWAIRDIGPSGQRFALCALSVSSVGRDAVCTPAEAVHQSFALVPA